MRFERPVRSAVTRKLVIFMMVGFVAFAHGATTGGLAVQQAGSVDSPVRVQRERPRVVTGKFPPRELYVEKVKREALQRAYVANNADDLPIVSWMIYGFAEFLLYSDGTLMAADAHAKSRLSAAKLTREEMEQVVDTLARREGFLALKPYYELTTWRHQALNMVTLRIPGKPVVSVAVYGELKPRAKEGAIPPAEFTEFLDLLTSLIPKKMKPWDPGYVEIHWMDCANAVDQSIIWPMAWPGLDGSLTRSVNHAVIDKIMIFPSSQIQSLDAFLAQRRERGAILINGRKMSADYRWPMRSEKQWSSWRQ